MIKVENLHKSFGELNVLKGLNAEIGDGECIAIIGGSGAGKSVFLRSLAMLEIPDLGHIWIDDEEITAPRCNLNKMREKMGLVSKARAMPQHLSGGQSQRVAIARCLAMNPKIILFDEPTSALDPTMVGEVLAIIRNLLSLGITMIIVTHEMRFAQDVASRIIYMDEGVVYEQGTPAQIFDNPQKAKTVNFIKKLKVFEYEIHNKDFDLIAMFSQINQFCEKYSLSKWSLFTVQLLIEEIITVLLDQYYLQNQPEISFTIEYSEADYKVKISILYQGRNLNIIKECMDEIQQKILSGKCDSCTHSYCKEVNEINIVI